RRQGPCARRCIRSRRCRPPSREPRCRSTRPAVVARPPPGRATALRQPIPVIGQPLTAWIRLREDRGDSRGGTSLPSLYVSHLRSADGTVICEHDEDWAPELHVAELSTAEPHDHDDHEHSHGLVDRSILRSRAGIRAVSWSLAILTVTALAQAFIYSRTLSVALLADLIHNFGDALTAIPLGLAFFFRSLRGE